MLDNDESPYVIVLSLKKRKDSAKDGTSWLKIKRNDFKWGLNIEKSIHQEFFKEIFSCS